MCSSRLGSARSGSRRRRSLRLMVGRWGAGGADPGGAGPGGRPTAAAGLVPAVPLALVALIAVLAFVAGGCAGSSDAGDSGEGDSGEGKSVSSVSSEGQPASDSGATGAPTSETGSPSPNLEQAWAAPQLPDVARKRTSAGAEAFARYYLRLVVYALNEGRPRALEARSTAGCVGCSALVGQVRDAKREGGGFRHDGLRVVRVVETTDSRPKRPAFEIDVRQGAWRRLDSQGAVVDSNSAQPVTQLLQLVWVAGEWRVARYAMGG